MVYFNQHAKSLFVLLDHAFCSLKNSLLSPSWQGKTTTEKKLSNNGVQKGSYISFAPTTPPTPLPFIKN
jgi:hypothetical protein